MPVRLTWDQKKRNEPAFCARATEKLEEKCLSQNGVRDMDLGVPNAHDNRRLEVVADGLPLFGGVQLAIDTTKVSSHRDAKWPRKGPLNRTAKLWKRPDPELVGEGGKARLIVLAAEFLSSLACP